MDLKPENCLLIWLSNFACNFCAKHTFWSISVNFKLAWIGFQTAVYNIRSWYGPKMTYGLFCLKKCQSTCFRVIPWFKWRSRIYFVYHKTFASLNHVVGLQKEAECRRDGAEASRDDGQREATGRGPRRVDPPTRKREGGRDSGSGQCRLHQVCIVTQSSA